MLYPGLRISVDALASSADQLPSITLKAPERLIGRNTEECMQSGAIYGYAAMLDGLIDRLESELRMPATTVITGRAGFFGGSLLPKTDHRQSEPAVGRSVHPAQEKPRPQINTPSPKIPLFFSDSYVIIEFN